MWLIDYVIIPRQRSPVDSRTLSLVSSIFPPQAPLHFNYTGVALPEPGRIVNDIKFVNGHFLMGMHANGPTTYSTASKGNADTFPPSTPLFSHFSGDDKYIVSLGFVVDGDGGATRNATRVLGALYGAGAIPALDNNRVFAAWLQRHVLFEVRRGRGGASSTHFRV